MARSTRLQLLTLMLVALALLWPAALPAPGAQGPPACLLYAEDGRCIPPPRPAGERGPMAVELGERPALALDPADATPRAGVLVRRRDDVSPEAFRALLAAEGLSEVEGLLLTGWWRAAVPEGESAEALAARLAMLPEVAVAEVEGTAQLLGEPFVPNDPLFPDQWGPQRVNAPQAWSRTLGSPDVLVAVLDSGFYEGHEDSPRNLLYADTDPSSPDFLDTNGHGTHVIGIAAAATNNERGVAGMCDGCSVLSIKVTDDSANYGISTTTVINALQVALATQTGVGARALVVNMSFGGGEDFCSLSLQQAVQQALQSGAVIVAAAGNQGNGKPPMCPALLPDVVAASATTIDDEAAPFSNTARSAQNVAIGAPGAGILSTVPDDSTIPPEDGSLPGYGWGSGTSMATPHVAGAAGLVWSAYPHLSAAEVRLLLTTSARVPAGWDPAYGAGILDVGAAMDTALRRQYLPLILREALLGWPGAGAGLLPDDPPAVRLAWR